MSRRARLLHVSLAALIALGGVGLTTAAPAGAVGADTVVPTDGVWGLDLAGGVLSTVEKAPNGDQEVTNRTVSADGATVGAVSRRGFAGTLANGTHAERVPCEAPGGCVPLRATGNGNVGYYVVAADGTERAQVWTAPNAYAMVSATSLTGGRFMDASGRFYVHAAASTGKEYAGAVNRYRSEDVGLTRAATAAAVWGTRLWTPGSGAGVVTSYDLKTKKTVTTVSTGAPCTVAELQVAGRWLYWNCGADGAAGVYDLTAQKNIAVPSGPALLGDGYLVQHDRTAGKLLLTDFHTGTAQPARTVADLPAGSTADQRRLTWAVDRFGGDIAYVGQDKAVHIVQSGVPSQPLAKIESDVDGPTVDPGGHDYGSTTWHSTFQYSKPASWSFTLKDSLGRAVRTVTGSGAEADVAWDGKTDAGTYAYNGAYTWTLTATAADGAGTSTTTGAVTLYGGLQGHHDQGGDRLGELLTLNSSGGLTLHYGDGTGTFVRKQSGSGWAAGTVAVPFGDMGSDRCADLLVRTPAGELRRYAGKCGTSAYVPGSSHTSLGTGWNAYNVLTAPGDLTGDGRVDLLARKASTGDIYVFANDGHGKLLAGKKIRSAWTTYTHIVGVGDLNGDGIGDVLARRKDGTVFRYDGAGDGTLKDRVTVFTAWGATYNTLVGVGDITGDGKADLVVRDSSGNLYRNDGKGNGSFTSRTKIATGWNVYKGVF
ncbi:FG-GAP-like repeat-containing protein [Streptomyces sp. VRA16 Mangrove soil]|uniref:FG-GAP-like repeat-containing protein n=1 Tax=Streptomyces sp. VRA16 Mangrove soil TaxID=2817434 RepID=UPI001A9D9A2F|nr:FG-GAP-like repeat-containing protein [Streptomyces sp. VRA16 Mangrove soil]MBO1337374.1 VCBS repeat-containing protein [Streptomyces sp. VRA16 Mangrove soil]